MKKGLPIVISVPKAYHRTLITVLHLLKVTKNVKNRSNMLDYAQSFFFLSHGKLGILDFQLKKN